MLNAVNSASDENILTYETTTGDFEWHTPSQLITDGTNLTWSGSTLNVDDSFLLNTGDTATGDYTITGTLDVSSLIVNSAYSFPLSDGTAGYVMKTNGTGTLTWAQDNNSGTWGSITGTLSNQTDLQAALDAKWDALGDISLTSGQIIVGSSGNIATAVAMSGDILITNTGSTRIGADRIT